MAKSPYRNFAAYLRAEGFIFKKHRGMGMRVINKTGSSIGKDKLVAISGFDTTAKLPKVVLADADVAAHRDVYVTQAAIADNSEANVLKGLLSAANLDTSAVSAAGDPVYLSTTAGAFTATKPTASNARVQVVGYATVDSATIGQIQWDIQPAEKLSVHEMNGLGFTTGQGGAVTQITSASTAVTLNTQTGQITTVALTTAAAAEEVFTVNNTTVAATDIIAVSTTYAGGGTPAVSVKGVASGAFVIVITNLHATAALDAVLVVNFVVIKGVAA